MPTYSRNGIENYRIAEKSRPENISQKVSWVLISETFQADLGKTLVQETKQADFQNWVSLYNRVPYVFSYLFERNFRNVFSSIKGFSSQENLTKVWVIKSS